MTSSALSVDVWWADLRQADVSLAGSLPPAERARVTEPGRPADRGRRLVAAALLQHAVVAARRVDGGTSGAASAGEAVGPVEVDRTCDECGRQHGRPVVAGGPHLSVAHSGVLVLVATCMPATVGVDVEQTGRFGGSQEETLAWARAEAAVKAGTSAIGSSRILRPPMPGYAAALCVASDARVTVTEHRAVLDRTDD